jgi:WD40 repeat protein
MGEFKPAKSEAQFCIANSGNYYISGGGEGSLFVWAGNKGPKCLKAHVGKVQCIVTRKNFIYSGGDDGKILRWRK